MNPELPIDVLPLTTDASAPEGLGFLEFIRPEGIPVALLLLLGGWLGLRLWTQFIDDIGERFTERRLFFKRIKALSVFFVYLTLGLLCLSAVVNLESRALFAVAGTLSVALGFAGKDLAASLMAGVILLLDQPFQVGDRVAFGGYYGEITDIGLRSVRLTTLDDNAVTIPNNKFLTEAVASANAGALDAMVVIPFYIAAAEDFQRARAIVTEATATSRYVYLRKPLVTQIRDVFLGERFVTVVEVKAYVFDVRYEKSFVTDVTERVKLAFRSQGIRAPDMQYRDLDLNEGRETP